MECLQRLYKLRQMRSADEMQPAAADSPTGTSGAPSPPNEDFPHESPLQTAATMKENLLLTHISTVVHLAENSALSEDFWTQAQPALEHLGALLNLPPRAAFIFSVFVEMSDDTRIRLKTFARFLQCNYTDILAFSEEIELLRNRQLIRRRHSDSADSDTYRVPQMVLHALRQGEVFTAPRTLKNLTIEQVFGYIDKSLDYLRQHELSAEEFCTEINELFENNLQLPFCAHCRRYTTDEMIDAVEVAALLYFCKAYVYDSEDAVSLNELRKVFGDENDQRFIASCMLANVSVLMRRWELVEYVKNGPFGEHNIFQLSAKAKQEFRLDELVKSKPLETNSLLPAGEIPAKRLFFNPEEQQQLDRLAELLQPERFDEVCRALQTSGMRQGFACLFYGAPGTGKTESVLQLARSTGRSIMQVDIAQSKSMWFGESEKRIQAIFDRYKRAVRQSELAPILLFNEADAIFSTRKTLENHSSVDQTENAMQNILLQEIEHLEGILIATTNLTQNLDKAFERRFLYKINFSRPAPETRQAIWQSLFAELTEEEARKLADEFDLSGGQIENVVRKSTVDRILHLTADSERLQFSDLGRYCREEAICNQMNNRRRIGY